MVKQFFILTGCLLVFLSQALQAQRIPDHIYSPDIRTPKLFQQNNQQGMALITLGSVEQLELHFDDMSGYPRNYYYTYQLCNADWTPVDLSPFQYIKGFTQNRLVEFRNSSFAATRYVHYQALLPERSCVPSVAGNYLLKVFLDGDTSKLAFTKRLLVLDSRVTIAAQVQPPFDNDLVRTHQKIQLSVNTQQLNILTPQQTHVVIIQNNRWDDAVKDIQPSFIRGRVLEYNSEQDCVFPAGKEYRWADLENFRFMSDRIEKIDPSATPFQIYIKPDVERNDLRYVYFKDRDGWDEVATTESVNPWWQTDYAYVHFTFVPSNHQPYAGRSVYLIGESTGNKVGDSSRMTYDAAAGVYRKTLYLKQGYYSYTYVTKADHQPDGKADATLTDGNFWETENNYTILFYYRGFADRSDQLVGVSTINSLNGVNGY